MNKINEYIDRIITIREKFASDSRAVLAGLPPELRAEHRTLIEAAFERAGYINISGVAYEMTDDELMSFGLTPEDVEAIGDRRTGEHL